MKPQRKNAGGRKSEQHPYHPHPKPSSVQSAVGGAHQESVSTATKEHARIDHQPSQQSSSARNEPSPLFKCDKSRALRNVVTLLPVPVQGISVTMIIFQGHSKVKQLRKFKVAYFGKCLPIQFKWQYRHLSPSVSHAQTLHRHRNNRD